MYEVIEFKNQDKYINDFLELPQKLYDKKTIVQNKKEEREILSENHLLSKYFKVYSFIGYKNKMPYARCILTIYPEDKCGYFGYFESEYDKEMGRKLLVEVEKKAKSLGCTTIKGPVDCSFWMRYRLKVNNFGKKPYISEPYNKSYYLKLIEAAGYTISESYVSNFYNKPTIMNSKDEKCKRRYEEFITKGYEIKSPKRSEFSEVIGEIYNLITKLYKEFPIFKDIRKDDFIQYFNSYKSILDFSFVKVAYYKGEIVAFVISMPDYGNSLYGDINQLTILKLFLKRIRSSRYVVLYMGVMPEHKGLGSAMTHTLIRGVYKKQAVAIGALIKEGKVTQSYIRDNIKKSNRYVLLEKEL